MKPIKLFFCFRSYLKWFIKRIAYFVVSMKLTSLILILEAWWVPNVDQDYTSWDHPNCLIGFLMLSHCFSILSFAYFCFSLEFPLVYFLLSVDTNVVFSNILLLNIKLIVPISGQSQSTLLLVFYKSYRKPRLLQ